MTSNGHHPATGAAERRRLRVTGTVQGVGFRPFVYREATRLGLSGFVLNDAGGVLIEVEGLPAALDALAEALTRRPPPLARVSGVTATVLEATGAGTGFRIAASTVGDAPAAPVSVDAAACDDCLAEVDDPADRRYRYPFTNCTNCGPRYTIVRSVPYDRPATTMSAFVMCEACQSEYDDPADRRFHAQPNACPVCGPRLGFLSSSGSVVAEGEAALVHAVAELLQGKVIAVKGLGGYHLAADATSEEAVALLRRRKHRDEKPFALMCPDLPAAHALCALDASAVAALVSPRRPIVLAPRQQHGAAERPVVASGVAPGLGELGVMLAYTPLHHLLLAGVGRPLVMTSGNVSDEPIAHEDSDAVVRLGRLVDGLLVHDRPIHIRCDDSVVRSTGSRIQAVRRSRGYAPEPMRLPAPARRHVVAVGAELKSTVAVAKGTMLVASHHIGDLEQLATYRAFLQACEHLARVFGVEPEVVVYDLHPEYLSTKYAEELDLDRWPVQHHHAHVASCLAEHGRTDRVLGVAFDGLGYGPDGTLWGGEFLVADLEGYERVGHLRPVALPGGSAAIREPWRMALSWIATAMGPAAAASLGPRLDERWAGVLALLESPGSGAAPPTSSAGRLFDAVACLLGVRRVMSYEGQAAIELEALASRVPNSSAPRYELEVRRSPDPDGGDGSAVLDPSPLVATILAELARDVAPARIAAGFHRSLGEATASLAADLAARHGLSTVALSGGVFQNARLSAVVEAALAERGLEVLVHESVPPNDGGISIGQAAIGATAARCPAP